jgi:hypothetical protein
MDLLNVFKEKQGERKVKEVRADADKKRKDILERDCNRCIACGLNRDLVIHHEIPVEEGLRQNWSVKSINQDNNLRTLCVYCHWLIHQDPPIGSEWAKRREMINFNIYQRRGQLRVLVSTATLNDKLEKDVKIIATVPVMSQIPHATEFIKSIEAGLPTVQTP